MNKKSTYRLRKWIIAIVAAGIILLFCFWGAGTGAARASESPVPTNQGLQVRLATGRSSFGTLDKVLLKVTITNTSTQTIKVLRWLTAAEGLNDPLFSVQVNGKPAAYIGKLVKRLTPTVLDYISLAPGASLEREVDLSDSYDLSTSGVYTVTYTVSSNILFGGVNAQAGSLQSNALDVTIAGREAPSHASSGPQTISGTTTFTGCSSSQQTDLTSARTAAGNYASEAKTSSAFQGPRYVWWFGTYDKTRHDLIVSHYTAISKAVDTASPMHFDCSTCTHTDWYAYVYPDSPYNYYLCGVFWTAPATGTDSKAGTIIHETTHFTVVAGTDDYAYGQTNAHALAGSNPGEAVMNADSHEYFAENNPARNNTYDSTTTINSDSPDPSSVNVSYTVSVTVSGSNGTPTGSVSVKDGTGATCTISALSSGSGSCGLTSTTTGSKTVTATYNGNPTYGASSKTATHTVVPAIPGGVGASDGSYTDKVSITWYTASGATSYQMFRNTTNNANSSTQIGTPSASPYADTTAAPGTNYYYFVKGCAASGCSGYSGGNIGYRAISAPGGVAATDGTYTDKVRVSWSAATGATSYQVYRNTSNSSSGSTQVGTPAASPYDDTTAAAGSTYYYFVKGCSTPGCSAFSTSNSGYRAITAPTGVDATDGTYTDKVRVVWNSATGASSYQIYRNSEDSSSGSTQIGTATTIPYDDTTAVENETYFYFVKGCSAAGCSAYSSSNSGYRAVLIVKPAVPTGVSATDGTYNDKVQVTWSATSGATYYEVYRNSSNSSSGASLLGSPTASPYNDTAAVASTTYYYFVKACNSAGCSSFSSSDSGYRAAVVVKPDAPTGVAATDGTDPGKVRVSWTASTGATYYEVYRNGSDSSSGSALLGSPGASPYDDTTAVEGALYYYFVKACNTAGCSDYSSSDPGYRPGPVLFMNYMPLLLRPAGPGDFNKSLPVDGANNQSVNPTLGWTASSGATSYDYCYQSGTSSTCTTTWTRTTATSVGLSGLSPSSTYSWQVRANNSYGSSTYADGDSGVFFSFTTGIASAGIINGNFEDGVTGWTEYSYQGWDIIVTSVPSNVTARSGTHVAWLGGDDYEISYVAQQVTISPSAPYLVYWHWIQSNDLCGYDFGGVIVDGSTVADIYDLCSSTATGGWVEHSVDLSEYIGQTIEVQIRAETDFSYSSNLFVEDVSLQPSATGGGEIEPFNPNPAAATTQGKNGILPRGEAPQGIKERRVFSPRAEK
jgi:fibronectin type 3 domain-containing protein